MLLHFYFRCKVNYIYGISKEINGKYYLNATIFEENETKKKKNSSFLRQKGNFGKRNANIRRLYAKK